MKPLDVVADVARVSALVDRRISPDDPMLAAGDDEQYFAVGSDAIRKIATVQTLVDAEEPGGILDFACGYGRVGRYLRVAYPEAELVGSDVNARALTFYRDTFGATVVPSAASLGEVDLGRRFDLIWSGSLMTHIPEQPAEALLALFDRHLADDGLAVFSTHGRYVASHSRTARWTPHLTEARLRELSTEFDDGRYAYSDYDNRTGYGISLTPLAWVLEKVERLPQLRLVGMTERGWGDFQDLVAVRRRPVSP